MSNYEVELQMDDSTDSQYEYTLDTAPERGHEAVAQLLVEHSADVNLQGGEHGNVLEASAAGGHGAMSRLLEHGAAMNILHGKYCNAIQAAVTGGLEEVVNLRLNKGIEVAKWL
ncbi:hypothetical protein VE04_01211 [Pseudogymnoascus sp. 24MN13]|nr:hypothetical protein VE04_01211 [Pseudogymnoascus sp. 24MN13]